ncbi:tetratricopeptide repeat protein [Catenulispora sp. GAS73]|uniref:tetratricopeptide repeat protein n=1 Tax=Catenulispora sp. GAS73 TaxID=3156269 RepID=UPI003518A475
MWDRQDTSAEPRPRLILPSGSATALARSPLGLGLDNVLIPPVPRINPEDKVQANPVVAEQHRTCTHCGGEVGRGTRGAPGPVSGNCPRCQTAYSFRPTLKRDDEVGHQYRVRGCIAYGGQGWVYLAHDKNLNDEPVAIKGLRDSANRHALREEKRILIDVRHDDIVNIRNFVQFPDADRGVLDSYIVLEFLPGVTLADKAREAGGVLPVPHAIAYVLATLPALAYLHSRNLAYGDFNPANVMQVGDRVKLLDMGGVTRIGTRSDQPWVTRGFVAPEVAETGPSIAADLYAVGRALAVLTAPFDYKDAYVAGLPGPECQAVFFHNEALYRFLLKATAPDPGDRFSNAAQMAQQLTGVLYETAALAAGPAEKRPNLAPSPLFVLERALSRSVVHGDLNAHDAALALPLPRFDDNDPSVVAFRRILDCVVLGDTDRARLELKEIKDIASRDWRRAWYSGLIELAAGSTGEAWLSFAQIRDGLPGEPAPKLALAVCAEVSGDYEVAEHYYRTVWRTYQHTGAAVGLARTMLRGGAERIDTSISVLESVPPEEYVTAGIEALRLRLGKPRLDAEAVRAAAERLMRLTDLATEAEHLELKSMVLEAARDLLAGNRTALGSAPLLGVLPNRADVGGELAKVYLQQRRHVERGKRPSLVRRAYRVRPWSAW